MTAGAIEVRDAQQLRRIRLRRPDKVNALNAAMMQAIADAVRGADPAAVDLIVIDGEGGKGFCAGADIAEFSQGVDRLARQEEALLAMIEALAGASVPVCVCAHGRSFGAGGILLALADLALVADDLSFGFPEIRFGMYPVIVHAALAYRLPVAQAAQLCLSGRLLDAERSRDLGLATLILPRADFEAGCERWIAFYRERATALAMSRQAWRFERRDEALRTRLDALAPLMLENFSGPGVRERIAAVLGGPAPADRAGNAG